MMTHAGSAGAPIADVSTGRGGLTGGRSNEGPDDT
jgi:hypothetical protein